MRDFLKLRFRAKGEASVADIGEMSPESAVRHAIYVLDSISRRDNSVRIDWDALGHVRDSLLDAGQKLASSDELSAYGGVIEDMSELRGQPPKWRD